MTDGGGGPVRVGLTLPSFQSDPERVLTVARAAEEAGLDGVFLFDHLFRQRGDAAGAERRPALELFTMTAAVAAATQRIVVGTLVARATLRPPGTTRAAFDTLARIAPGRIVAGLGAGDDDSLAEDTAFGVMPLANPDVAQYRVARFEETVTVLAGREYPVWVAGTSPASIRLAATADGWNTWGGTPGRFEAAAAKVGAALAAAGRHPGALAAAGRHPGTLAAAGRHPGALDAAGSDPAGFASTWGGLAVLAADPGEAKEKWDRLGGGRTGIVHGTPPEVADQIAAYAAAGAAWVILGPIDSADPANAALLGEARRMVRR